MLAVMDRTAESEKWTIARPTDPGNEEEDYNIVSRSRIGVLPQLGDVTTRQRLPYNELIKRLIYPMIFQTEQHKSKSA